MALPGSYCGSSWRSYNTGNLEELLERFEDLVLWLLSWERCYK